MQIRRSGEGGGEEGLVGPEPGLRGQGGGGGGAELFKVRHSHAESDGG